MNCDAKSSPMMMLNRRSTESAVSIVDIQYLPRSIVRHPTQRENGDDINENQIINKANCWLKWLAVAAIFVLTKIKKFIPMDFWTLKITNRMRQDVYFGIHDGDPMSAGWRPRVGMECRSVLFQSIFPPHFRYAICIDYSRLFFF